jgi:hypothetical protein
MQTAHPSAIQAKTAQCIYNNFPNCKSYFAISASYCGDDCLISAAADNRTGPCSVGSGIGAKMLPCHAIMEGHGIVRAQSCSDVIDVVDARSFEVKEK